MSKDPSGMDKTSEAQSNINWDNQSELDAILKRQSDSGLDEAGPASKEERTHCSELCAAADTHIKISRSWRSVFPHLVIYFVACFLTVVLSREFPELILYSTVDIFGMTFQVAMPLLGLVAAILLARPLFIMYDTNHKITCHHIRSTSGICSLRKSVVDMPFENIKGVGVNQSLLERILNVGSIVVWTAMTSSPELVMGGIGNPERYVQIIRERIDEVHLQNKHA